MLIRSFLVTIALLLSVCHVSAQIPVVNSNDTSRDPQQLVAHLKEGDFLVTKAASCSIEKVSFLYKKETCTSGKVVIMSKGLLMEKGGEVTEKKTVNSIAVSLMIGGTLMMIAIVLLLSSMSDLDAHNLFIIAAIFFTLITLLSAISEDEATIIYFTAVALFVSSGSIGLILTKDHRKITFLLLAIYELLIIFSLLSS